MLALVVSALTLRAPVIRVGTVRCSAVATEVQSWYDSGLRLSGVEGVVAPAGTPPAPSVSSWYDSGIRLVEPAPVEPAPKPQSWGLMGPRAVSPHRMRGTMPKPPPRELFKPPPGWEPPSKPEPEPMDLDSLWGEAVEVMGAPPAGFEWGGLY